MKDLPENDCHIVRRLHNQKVVYEIVGFPSQEKIIRTEDPLNILPSLLSACPKDDTYLYGYSMLHILLFVLGEIADKRGKRFYQVKNRAVICIELPVCSEQFSKYKQWRDWDSKFNIQFITFIIINSVDKIPKKDICRIKRNLQKSDQGKVEYWVSRNDFTIQALKELRRFAIKGQLIFALSSSDITKLLGARMKSQSDVIQYLTRKRIQLFRTKYISDTHRNSEP